MGTAKNSHSLNEKKCSDRMLQNDLSRSIFAIAISDVILNYFFSPDQLEATTLTKCAVLFANMN